MPDALYFRDLLSKWIPEIPQMAVHYTALDGIPKGYTISRVYIYFSWVNEDLEALVEIGTECGQNFRVTAIHEFYCKYRYIVIVSIAII